GLCQARDRARARAPHARRGSTALRDDGGREPGPRQRPARGEDPGVAGRPRGRRRLAPPRGGVRGRYFRTNFSVFSAPSFARKAIVGSGSPASSRSRARSDSWWRAPSRLTASTRIVRLRSEDRRRNASASFGSSGAASAHAPTAAERTSWTYAASV